MRTARIKLRGRTAVYHCISRIVGGQFLLEDCGQEKFRQLLWQQAQFCGLQIVTYCLMPNHVHLLVRVPAHPEVPDRELLRRVERFYGPKSPLAKLLRQGLQRSGRIPADLRAGLVARMGDISVFMKELKQRFSRWYNKQTGRYGTLWAERFKSLLVEDQPDPLGTVAAYIDLNPVRAGGVEDPKDYRFCGYGEAMGGNRRAREGILSFQEARDWRTGGLRYRQELWVRAGRAGRSGKVVLDPERIRRALARGAQISRPEALRLRIRYLSDGVVLGSQGYVNEVFAKFRDRFGPRRKSGARRLRGLPFPGLFTLRDLRVSVIS